jgi:3-hydroxyisobutyrate dehydrogenase-like beta-hydroxyacid dehydrogenase
VSGAPETPGRRVTTRPVVGFIGLGSQGGPMADAVIDAGYDTVLWARRGDTVDPYRERASIATSPADLAEQADVVGLCVLTDDDVDDIALRPDGLLAGIRPGSTLLIHSTTHPDTCARLGERFSERQVHVLDAPVSGGGLAAREHRLLVMVGGDRTAYESVLPVLSTFGNPVLLVGPLGSGQVTKLVNNLLVTANLSLAHQAVQLGHALGVDEEAMVNVLRHGSGRSFGLEMYAGLRGDFATTSERVRSVARLLHKDVDLAERIAGKGAASADLLVGAADRVLAAMGQPRLA